MSECAFPDHYQKDRLFEFVEYQTYRSKEKDILKFIQDLIGSFIRLKQLISPPFVSAKNVIKSVAN